MTRWIALLLVLLSAQIAYADAAPLAPQVEEHRSAALAAFNLQDFVRAADEYRKAYELSGRAAFLYSVAQAERLAGNYARAILAFEAFLRTNPSAYAKQLAEENIARCETQQKARAEELKVAKPFVVLPPAPVRWYRDPLAHTLLVTAIAALVAGPIVLDVGNQGMSRINGATDLPTYEQLSANADRYRAEQIAGISVAAVGGALLVGATIRYAVDAVRTRRYEKLRATERQ